MCQCVHACVSMLCYREASHRILVAYKLKQNTKVLFTIDLLLVIGMQTSQKQGVLLNRRNVISALNILSRVRYPSQNNTTL